MSLIFFIIVAAIVIFPMWKIFTKTGQSPALALLMLIPAIGPLTVSLIFGYGRWPNYDR